MINSKLGGKRKDIASIQRGSLVFKLNAIWKPKTQELSYDKFWKTSSFKRISVIFINDWLLEKDYQDISMVENGLHN